MKNSIFARFARAFFIFWHFEDVLVPSTTWNDLFCSFVDDDSVGWQMFNFVFSCPKRLFQINSRTVRTHFSIIMTLNNWKVIAETRSYIFKWRSRFSQRRVCLSSLVSVLRHAYQIWKPQFLSVVQFPFDNCHSPFSPTTFSEIGVCLHNLFFIIVSKGVETIEDLKKQRTFKSIFKLVCFLVFQTLFYFYSHCC